MPLRPRSGHGPQSLPHDHALLEFFNATSIAFEQKSANGDATQESCSFEWRPKGEYSNRCPRAHGHGQVLDPSNTNMRQWVHRSTWTNTRGGYCCFFSFNWGKVWLNTVCPPTSSGPTLPQAFPWFPSWPHWLWMIWTEGLSFATPHRVNPHRQFLP